MMKLQVISKIKSVTKLTGLKIDKISPEIFIGVGIVGFVGTVVAASVATVKAKELLEEASKDIEAVELAREKYTEEKYSEEDYRRDQIVVRVQTGMAVLRLYAPAIILGGLSIASFVRSHHILSRRNLALMAMYKALDEGFMKYRARVIEDLGPEKDWAYFNGYRETEVTDTVVDEETGKKKKVKRTIAEAQVVPPNPYGIWFKEGATKEWRGNRALNMWFLRNQMKFLNQLLQNQEHVFLNEVFDALGMERSEHGQFVGWIKDNPNADGFIDFGFDDPYNLRQKNEEEMHQIELEQSEYGPDAVYISFNCDGIMHDMI